MNQEEQKVLESYLRRVENAAYELRMELQVNAVEDSVDSMENTITILELTKKYLQRRCVR
jgi:hypothetical protein